ncbi:hypothetical protein GCM10010967_16390 [Dyadobacter beijingensis]|uniref:Uncharacterized protein n=2 Tax=Dyadobacter beijingensis TaxID=365489 RepID=A0ABQ2HMV9_9BACT|nr:hypothetical protein GCM10010967_16390 [Dyadobacter beijingensis]
MGINKILPALNGDVIVGYAVQQTRDNISGENSQGGGRWCSIESGTTYEAFFLEKNPVPEHLLKTKYHFSIVPGECQLNT